MESHVIIPGWPETDVRKPPGCQKFSDKFVQNGFSISPPPRSLDDDVRASSLSILTRAPLPVFSESKSVHKHMSIVVATKYMRKGEIC